MTEHDLLRGGLQHHQAGRFPDAAACYRQVLRANPAQPDALYLFAVLAHQTGNHAQAIESARRALEISGPQPRIQEVLGLALMAADRLAEAEPYLAAATQAETPESFNNFGILRKKQARFEDAIAAFTHALHRNPDFADARYNLGNAHRGANQLEPAVACFERVVAAGPAHADALAALGQTLCALGRHREALDPLTRAIELRPRDAALRCDLAAACEALREFADAAAAYRAALAIDPARHETQHNLAHCLFELGDADAALALFRQAAQGPHPELPRAMIAVMIPGAPAAGNREILEARRAFAQLDLPAPRPSPPPRAPHSPLRLGYVSSFFHRQNWMKPVWPLIAHHDRARFEIHIFSDAPASAMPEGYRAQPRDQYHDISALTNEQAAALIESQGVDVLIDLNGYSKLRRLPLFNLRPAPLIVAWFNQFATTGMSCYDYLIGDDHVIPADEEPFYTEKILRVPGSYLTFDVTYPVPELVDPPCLETGAITFGCLAPLYKITPRAIEAWSRILREAPAGALVLRGSALQSKSACRYVRETFATHGISESRLRLYGPADHYRFLETYNQIDIALDTFPYNGGTTTSEAIWQGVPVIAFHGDRWVSRTSASILRAANLGRWVARDLESYIAQAIHLAMSPDTAAMLTAQRRGMRGSLRQSSICDTQALASKIERLVTHAFRKKTEARPAPPTASLNH